MFGCAPPFGKQAYAHKERPSGILGRPAREIADARTMRAHHLKRFAPQENVGHSLAPPTEKSESSPASRSCDVRRCTQRYFGHQLGFRRRPAEPCHRLTAPKLLPKDSLPS